MLNVPFFGFLQFSTPFFTDDFTALLFRRPFVEDHKLGFACYHGLFSALFYHLDCRFIGLLCHPPFYDFVGSCFFDFIASLPSDFPFFFFLRKPVVECLFFR